MIGNNLKLLRKQFSKSQDDISKKLGLNRSTYSGYENAVAQPSLELITRICDYYNISVDTLLRNDFSTYDDKNWKSLQGAWKQNAKGTGLRILTSQVSDNNDELIEMIPAKAKAGYTSGYADPEFIKELPTIRLPFLSKNRKHRTFPISGDSMPPVSDGSFVVGEFIEDWTSIPNDTACIIVTSENGIVFKILENNLKENKTFLLSSTNSFYEPYAVGVNEVIEVWRFRCYISMELPSFALEEVQISDSLLAIKKSLYRIENKS
ncbi:MAG: helix-turn-helix transcriptional regulator [Crocinitomicaceae bacterium]|jgi:transcriptional regulator with XRE-family HTH domain|tara:strand:- start:4175 stop:4966 length:792 start_codon:yes stop_codon:yes gene_type:complete